MKERFLILTALEESWPKKNQPVLFLGEWCRVYSRKKIWEEMDFEILEYPWNNKKKLNVDSKYCSELIEVVLIFLTDKLNEIHGVNHSVRYWRILIGPWLINFIPILFERWTCLDKALSTKSISGVIISNHKTTPPVPSDMHNFSTLQESDWWNFHIYSQILKLTKYKKVIHKNLNENGNNSAKEESSLSLIFFKLKRYLQNLFSIINLRNKRFIITPYIPLFKNIMLNLKWLQLPLIYKFKALSYSKTQSKYRDWSFPDLNSDTEFESILKKLIPLQIPIAYLEGLEKLHKNINTINWPKRPDFIWTSNSYYLDEIFKLWAAEKVETGVPLIIGQHGGHYGQGLLSFPESHELKICDHFLSWGWKSDSKKVKPIGILKKINMRSQKKPTLKKALFVISGAPRYSGTFLSMPIAGQILKYLNDQFEFYSNLSNKVSSCLNIRLYPYDYYWNQYERWKSLFPDAQINNGKDSFTKLLSNSKLVICGWNTTTYLESMTSDIPTVIFWDPDLFELREEALNSFDELKRVGIFHEQPNLAAIHVMKIWDDVDTWWKDPKVVEAKNNFVNKYAKTGNLINNLHTVLNKF